MDVARSSTIPRRCCPGPSFRLAVRAGSEVTSSRNLFQGREMNQATKRIRAKLPHNRCPFQECFGHRGRRLATFAALGMIVKPWKSSHVLRSLDIETGTGLWNFLNLNTSPYMRKQILWASMILMYITNHDYKKPRSCSWPVPSRSAPWLASVWNVPFHKYRIHKSFHWSIAWLGYCAAVPHEASSFFKKRGKCGVYFVVIGANLNYAVDAMSSKQWAIAGGW